jgi:cell division septation protein DedD
MSEGQDTEITLGTGRLLGLFFGLVIVCALFFGLGFSMGRNSVKSTLTMEETPSATMPAQANAGQKVRPGVPEKPAPAPDTATSPADASAQNGTANASAPVVTSPAPFATAAVATNAPEIGKASSIAPTSGAYTVQVAAVSKQEDADALVSALKKKSYPVFVASNATDKLFHVQIGPFNDIKDAESMKSKLTSDGYNPIVKR